MTIVAIVIASLTVIALAIICYNLGFVKGLDQMEADSVRIVHEVFRKHREGVEE